MAAPVVGARARPHFKDEILDRLAELANVAQFVSFAPGQDPAVRFARVHGARKATAIRGVDEAATLLLRQSADGRVNVRSFDPEQPKSSEFVYGLDGQRSVAAEVRRLAARGLYTIVNETIDINDGGVSGVSYAGVVEFAPDDTPRCVDQPGTASLPRELGLRILRTVYGFAPELNYPNDIRVEFSIHPLRRGVRHEHTIVWEQERTELLELRPEFVWPNRFSRFLGDKVFGLLIADNIGLRVPRTRVIARRVPPFEFGEATASGEYWFRTAPVEPVPGRFTTMRGWPDPFRLMTVEDPSGEGIAAVIAQEGVESLYSGAAASGRAEPLVEGVSGSGDRFMQGAQAPEPLPASVIEDVEETLSAAAAELGDVRLEWVHDGVRVWVVQMHRGSLPSSGLTIYPGESTTEHRFPVEKGLEALRDLAERLRGTGEGVMLVGSVGVTSHLGDILRRERIPSRILVPAEPTPDSF
jgi:hypothetical protein